MLITLFPVLLWFIALASAAQVTGVFTGINSITPGDKAWPKYPSWTASIAWKMDASKVKAGDTFKLEMPYVFKFTTSSSSILLTAGGKTFATCSLTSGENLLAYSEIDCTALLAITSVQSASGTFSVTFTFSSGATDEKLDLEAAAHWKAGANTVSFNDGTNTISTTVNMAAGATYFGSGHGSGAHGGRTLPSLNKLEMYFLDASSSRTRSGSLSLLVALNTPLDCSSSKAFLTTKVNAWEFPQNSFDSVQGATFKFKCSSLRIDVTYTNLPAQYTPYIEAYSVIPVSNIFTVAYRLSDQYNPNRITVDTLCTRTSSLRAMEAT